ncbi:hypothetical protein ANN_06294 [Periplaneta americana]|uniref:Uncharacterized protein n=1 Tax=Periplaneta americana TaxID=6978 RepID=A0ABQ8TEE9_PERAM|nr:hypothetical protein ANN_06294 [Periplaneta americana]
MMGLCEGDIEPPGYLKAILTKERLTRPHLWSNGQRVWPQNQVARVRIPVGAIADSLFSSGYTFGGPTPPPPPAAAPPYSPVSPLVERGITQLELMAKGFNNNNNNSNTNNNNINNLNGVTADTNVTSVPVGNTKKVENKRRSECALYQETVERRQPANGGSGAGNKRRWERDSSQAPPTPPIVKNEVTARPSCGCRRSSVTTKECVVTLKEPIASSDEKERNGKILKEKIKNVISKGEVSDTSVESVREANANMEAIPKQVKELRSKSRLTRNRVTQGGDSSGSSDEGRGENKVKKQYDLRQRFSNYGPRTTCGPRGLPLRIHTQQTKPNEHGRTKQFALFEGQNESEAFEMWIWRRMERVKWTVNDAETDQEEEKELGGLLAEDKLHRKE